MRNLRGAIVGYGFIAEKGHAPAYRATEKAGLGLEIVAIADGCPARRDKAAQDVVSVFILPPSAADLERRLHTRAQDSREVIRGRMSRASHELSHWAEYDYIVVNHAIEEAFAEVQSILKAERLKRESRIGLTEFVRGLQKQLER